MAKSKHNATPVEIRDEEHIRKLVARLLEAERNIEEFLGGQIDAVLDPIRRAPILLREAQEVLVQEASIRQMAEILRNVPDSVIVLDQEGRITYWNEGAERLFGYPLDEAVGQHFLPLCDPDDALGSILPIGNVPSDDESHTELTLQRKDGERFWAECRMTRMPRPRDTGFRIIAVVRDISERKSLEQRMREARNLAEGIVETVREPLVVLDPDLRIVRINPSFCQTFHVLPEEATDRLLYEIGRRQFNIPKLRQMLTRIITDHESFYDLELAVFFKGIGKKTLLFTGRPIQRCEHDLMLILLAIEDVTGRREAEEALKESEAQLQQLSRALLAEQDAERKQVAADVHDSLGGILSAIKYQFEAILHGNEGGEMPAESLRDVIPLIKQAIDDVRRITTRLRPSLLDNLGILATIRWLARTFEDSSSMIAVSTRISVSEEDIPDQLKEAIYRILQEGMDNVADHSRADRVVISIAKDTSFLILEIHDNGIGFDVQKAFSSKGKKQAVGMRSMRERTHHSGGMLSVVSEPHGGTTIRVKWPITYCEPI